MKKYWVIFLSKGIAAGVLIGLLSAIPIDHFGVFFFYGGGAALIFGFFTALSAYQYDQELMKRGFENPTNDAYQFRTLVINNTIEELMPACKKTMLSLKKSTLVKEDFECGVLSIKTGITYHYYGEMVELSLKKVSEKMTLLELKSYPKTLLPFVTHAKNLDNVETVVQQIKEQFKSDIVVE